MKQTFRIILTVLAVFLLVNLLTGCQKQSKVEELDGHGKRFVRILNQDYFWVYVDTETGVEWVFANKTFTPIIDSYGKPYIYPAFDAREDKLP